MPTLLGVADLANNLASATKGLATSLGLAQPEPAFIEYPDQAITAQFQREQWYKNPQQGLYAFSVEDVTAGQGIMDELPSFATNIASLFDTENGFFSSKKHFGEFQLPITPQEISQVEDFAVSIRPTQGGTVVNHSGNKYKTLSISGTTGVEPFRGLLGVYKDNGVVIGKPDDLQYRSGYEVFQHFRNWMRSYIATKAVPGNENLRLTFKNYKDWEFLYVEPLKFSMKRDASKPLLYNYTIQFKVIGVRIIQKPLFELVVNKISEVADAAVNSFVLIKTNTDITDAITGDISDFLLSLNQLKLALKASLSKSPALAEVTTKESGKLSKSEGLALLNTIGTFINNANNDPKKAEAGGYAPAASDPTSLAKDLVTKAQNPSLVDSVALQQLITSLLKSEAAIMTQLPISVLPTKVQQAVSQNQVAAAAISKVAVQDIKTQAQDIYDKLVTGLGASDSVYNQIFGVTSSSLTATSSSITDDQFTMLYALSQTIGAIDGVLGSDQMFDTNAQKFKQSNSTNGADSVGQGVFSLPDPSTGVKEGILPANVTLEDIALFELGDTSRWTELAELNGLKSPYIVQLTDVLAPRFNVQSQNYYNPTQIQDLQITFTYVIPSTPTPTGAWAGKGNYMAEYLGGDPSAAVNWRFFFPDDGVKVFIVPTQQYLEYSATNGAWEIIDTAVFTLDGVLKPGDKIKIPMGQASPIVSTHIQGPRDNIFTNGLSAVEKSMGVDLKLTKNMDLNLTPSGDLDVTTGVNNLAQAIILKLLYQKGSLKKFPAIGSNLAPGRKTPTIGAIRTDITTSLLQDTRIQNVTNIGLQLIDNTLNVVFQVFINGVQQPVPITIPV